VENLKPFKGSLESEIAIIGMAGRFPGAQSIDAFWNNLRDGTESITFFTDEQLQASGVSPETLHNPNYVKARPLLENVELFDAAFFGINPREAQGMDPQYRLFLECVWEAMENAGYDTDRYSGKISLIAGSGGSSYLENHIHANPEAMALLGSLQTLIMNSADSLTTHIAYKLNLKGACYSVQAFCSTSLVAVHLACQCLLNFECDMAVAGGVSVLVPQNAGYWYEESSILSPDGHCRAFDAEARGMVFGNGLGVVVLKRLEDALADGDHIEAVIKGSATNNDGSLKVGYTAPSVAGQAEVIVEALANAGVEPETITYVETHGTGTALGDPAEMTALTKAFRSGTQKKGFCAIGSVKTNVGHLDRASGVTSLIKTILALKHKEIPPSLHFKNPNPDIDFENSPFYVSTKLSKWMVDGGPRRAGVSNFGFGGTNAHVILEEAPVVEPSIASRPFQLLLLSAKTISALETATKNLAAGLRQTPHLNLADVAYTLQIGRRAFSHRRMIVCQDLNDTVSTLEEADVKRILTVYQEKRNPPAVFMFSGQGAQYVNMGLELYRTESTFREEVDRCSEILKPHLSLDLRGILYPDERNGEGAADKLKQTFITQPALFVIEYALAKLWMSWGIHPAAMVGHSIGEYVAACLAEVFSLEDALVLVATRGRLMQQRPAGSMLAVQLSEKGIERFLNQRLSLAAVNAPGFCVVSGETEAVKQLESDLEKSNVAFTPLHTSHAFHSKMMEPILDAFKEQVGRVRVSPPKIPFVSNLTGTWITSEEAMDPSYWAKHLRQTVRFSDCMQELLKEPNRVFLEVGPGQTLSILARQHLDGSKGRVVLSSIRHPKEQKSDIAFILNTLGRLWLAGVEVDWSGFYKDERRHRIPLPTYPFERQRYWIEPAEQPRSFFASQAGLGKMEDISKHSMGLELLSDYLAPRNPELQSTYVAPRNEVEETIAKIWQKLLGIKQIGIHDNYFDLGGTSVLAVRLFAQIEKIFGKKMPLGILFDHPTVGELAIAVAERDFSASWSSLVRIQAGGTKPPFFCVHSADANVLEYLELAKLLGNDQPFYVLQPPGLDGSKKESPAVEGMAADYIKEIRKVQPKGPYYIGGYCLGGLVAFEMAQQLVAEGERVPLLALVSSPTPEHLKNILRSFTVFHHLIYRFIERVELEFSNLSALEPREKISYVKQRFERLVGLIWVRAEGVSRSVLRRLGLEIERHSFAYDFDILIKALEKVYMGYSPRIYPGRLTLFRVSKQTRRLPFDPTLGWEGVAEGGIEDYEVFGYHKNILKQPNVRAVAEKLRHCLEHSQTAETQEDKAEKRFEL
jgi:acyl transferase domain-containing protein/thioesterase domain-containing protein